MRITIASHLANAFNFVVVVFWSVLETGQAAAETFPNGRDLNGPNLNAVRTHFWGLFSVR